MDRLVKRVLEKPRRPLVRYSVGAAFMVAALIIQALVAKFTGATLASATLFVAVVMATAAGGAGPGILSAVIGSALGLATIGLSRGWDGLSTVLPALGTYAAINALLIYVTAIMRRALQRANTANTRFQSLFDNMQQAFVLYQAVRSKEDGPYDDLLRVEMNSVALKASAHAPGTTVRQTFPNADPKWVAALLSVALTGKGGRWEQPGATRDTWYELDAYSPEPGHCAVLMTDITERRQHNEARELLAREVEHRSKNLFAVVLSLLQLTKGKSVDEDLIGRMTTLARIHSTLKLRDGASTDLKSVIGMELEPFITEGSLSQVSFDGPDIDLNAVEAQAIGMAVHELTTNAAKYGALSRPDGRLRVMWAREGGGTISLSWRESGGPPTPNSEKPGFGGRLLQGLIQGQLHGSIRPLWDTTGLTIDIRFEVSDTGVSEAPRAVA